MGKSETGQEDGGDTRFGGGAGPGTVVDWRGVWSRTIGDLRRKYWTGGAEGGTQELLDGEKYRTELLDGGAQIVGRGQILGRALDGGG